MPTILCKHVTIVLLPNLSRWAKVPPAPLPYFIDEKEMSGSSGAPRLALCEHPSASAEEQKWRVKNEERITTPTPPCLPFTFRCQSFLTFLRAAVWLWRKGQSQEATPSGQASSHSKKMGFIKREEHQYKNTITYIKQRYILPATLP